MYRSSEYLLYPPLLIQTLQIHPKLLTGAKIMVQAQACIARNGEVSVENPG
jgi:hypothetical protein